MSNRQALLLAFVFALLTMNDCFAAVRLSQAEARIQRLEHRQCP